MVGMVPQCSSSRVSASSLQKQPERGSLASETDSTKARVDPTYLGQGQDIGLKWNCKNVVPICHNLLSHGREARRALFARPFFDKVVKAATAALGKVQNPDKVAKLPRSKITMVELGTKWEKFPTNDHHYDDLHPSSEDQCYFHDDHYDNLCCTTKGNSNCDYI